MVRNGCGYRWKSAHGALIVPMRQEQLTLRFALLVLMFRLGKAEVVQGSSGTNRTYNYPSKCRLFRVSSEECRNVSIS